MNEAGGGVRGVIKTFGSRKGWGGLGPFDGLTVSDENVRASLGDSQIEQGS